MAIKNRNVPDNPESRRIGASIRGGGVQHFWLPKGTSQLPRVAKAEGVYVWDTQGNRYFDMTSGPVAVNLGHGNRRVIAAMQEQAARVCFSYPAYLESEPNSRLADLLAAQAGPGHDRAFFVSSGAEAVEKAIEFARLHAVARGEASRFRVISRLPAFHGSTLATQALSEDPDHSPLQPMLQRWPRVPVPFPYRPPKGLTHDEDAARCAEILRETIEREGPETVLAFIIEPVMGLTGGASYAPAGYYRRIREICTNYGVILIHDEVMSGVGRTGRFLAGHHWPGTQPDLIVLAKGLGSGYHPIAGFLAPDAMVETVVEAGGFHLGHTQKSSPLACAVGLAVVQETLERDLVSRAERHGATLRERLRALQDGIPILGDVRGLGLFNAIEIVADPVARTMLPRNLDVPAELSRLGREHGLLIYARRIYGGRFGDWIMVTPPLIIEPAEMDQLVERLAATLLAYQDRLRAAGHLG
ncbi:MAG: aspartate aminotransferase family protein [Gammaproteobacteria bacterium]|nr:aspartate aminotransferase family protein [Gammaproteobacteria bacterium]